MAPQEAWSGEKPNVEHFQVFGCIAYAQIPEVKRKKLDDRGENVSSLDTLHNLKLIRYTIQLVES